MKSILMLAIGLACLFGPDMAHAQVRHDRGAERASNAGGAGNHGGGSDPGSIYQAQLMCNQGLTVLDDALEHAAIEEARGHLETAREALLTGISDTLASLGGMSAETSLTYRALERGTAVSIAVTSAIASDQAISDPLRMQIIFLKRYYGFLKRIAQQIDLSFYIPYSHHADLDTAQFERRYVDYAYIELQWVFDSFLDTAPSIDGVGPVGSAKAYLKLLEFMSQYAAEDLAMSLWQGKFACATEALSNIHKRLAEYNLGNQAYYGNDQIAINLTFHRIHGLMQSFSVCSR